MEDGQNCDDMNTNPDLVVFEEVNQAVFQSNCVGCHSGQFPAAGVDLSSFDGAKAAASRVEFQVVNGMMPPPSRPSLSQNQKDLVAAWVQDGAVDEIGAVLCDEMMKE
jgi:mono/diheme cytochrome c family protein